MDSCNICKAYIYDTISIDSHQLDMFHGEIKWKTLKKHSNVISEELYKCLIRINSSSFNKVLEITNNCCKHIHKSNIDLYFYCFYRSFELLDKQNDLVFLHAYLEDLNLSNDTISIKKIIGFWIYIFYTDIQNVHMEHLKMKENSFNGNPFRPIVFSFENQLNSDDLYI